MKRSHGHENQADTKDLTSSSKFSGSCVHTLQTHPWQLGNEKLWKIFWNCRFVKCVCCVAELSIEIFSLLFFGNFLCFSSLYLCCGAAALSIFSLILYAPRLWVTVMFRRAQRKAKSLGGFNLLVLEIQTHSSKLIVCLNLESQSWNYSSLSI